MNMEYLPEGIRVAVIGFSVVMIALVILWMIMVAFSRFLSPEQYRRKSTESDSSDSQAAAGRRADDSGNGREVDSSRDPQLIAAITAAVSMVMSGDGGAAFRIVSVRPIRPPESRAWKFSGRTAQLNARPRQRQ